MTNALQTNRLGHLWPTTLGDVDRLFDNFFGGTLRRGVGSWYAPLSIWEADNNYHVELDVPGVRQEDVDVSFEKGELRISVERKAPEGERKVWYDERGFGQMSRVVALPESADPGSITAELSGGTLHVTVAKVPEAQPKKIEIKSA
jgi:HSP20 family protein